MENAINKIDGKGGATWAVKQLGSAAYKSLAIGLAAMCALTARADQDSCLQDKISHAPGNVTVDELRASWGVAAARDDTRSVTQRRITAERQSVDRAFSITAHKPNLILPATYNDTPNTAPFDAIGEQGAVEELEAIIQVSVKFPLVNDLFNRRNDIFFAYTTRAWWQAYNSELSKPFRETNYEPEVFLRHYGGPSAMGLALAHWDIGYVHQSNGRSQALTRSWDRLFARTMIDIGSELSLMLESWYRLPESKKHDELPREYQYFGYGQMRFIYANRKNTYTYTWRPGTKKQSSELTWSYPLSRHFRFYVSYFHGYGESLLDFSARTERIGIGFAVNDFLLAEQW